MENHRRCPIKISPYAFKEDSQDAKDFKDEVSHLLNYGKYQIKVLYGGTPTWTGKSGEYVLCYILDAGTNTYHFYDYYYIGEPVNQWLFKVAIGIT